MARIVMLGSTGRIGSLAVDAARADGHEVVALVRRAVGDPDPALRYIVGPIDDAAAIREALTGADAVIAALGPRANTPSDAAALVDAMAVLVGAMRELGISRLVALSGAAVDVPGDTKPVFDRLASRIVRRAARHVVGAKQREYEVFAATDLAWTALRPPIVKDGDASSYRLSASLTPGARVTRSAVARALVDQATDDAWVRRAPFVLPP